MQIYTQHISLFLQLNILHLHSFQFYNIYELLKLNTTNLHTKSFYVTNLFSLAMSENCMCNTISYTIQIKLSHKQQTNDLPCIHSWYTDRSIINDVT
jgi:hypothetical protein